VTKVKGQGLLRQMDESAAIRRVLDGDVEAFSGLVHAYHGRCSGYALRMLRNRESAEDVVQETFVRAFRGLKGYDHRNRFAAWLFRILVNRCHSAARSGARQGRQARVEDLPSQLEPQVDPQDFVTRAAVESALDRLAPEQREAFILRHVEQLSYEEMRTVTGAGISALKMRVARACENLRKELGHERG
jgi:RNA polymerase sigma-70 factor, ECF subfamily